MATFPGRGGLALRPDRHSSSDRFGPAGAGPGSASWRTGPVPTALATSAVLFVIDWNAALGIAVGSLYVIPVLIASLVASRRFIIAVAAIASLLILAGWLVSTGDARAPSLANRSISLLAVWATAALALRLATVTSIFAQRVAQEHAAAVEVHESMRLGLTRLLTLSDQIARSGATTSQAAQRLRSRAQVMLTALGLLSRSRGEPVELSAMLRSLLPGTAGDALRVDGPPIMIPPRQIQPLALIFHELLANCRAHGVLRGSEGRINVRWTVEEMSAEPARRVSLVWQESGGRPLEGQPSPGFGTALITNAVVHDLSGSVEMSYPEEGCRHQFQFIIDSPAPHASR